MNGPFRAGHKLCYFRAKGLEHRRFIRMGNGPKKIKIEFHKLSTDP